LGEEFASRQQAKVLSPIAGYLYGTSHRDAITVLLIDEASLEKVGLTWPAPYAYEARLLRAIGRFQPKAVFVDIYFKDNRKASDITQLVREVCALKDKGIDVYLGATRDANMQFTVRPELEEKAGECFKKVALYFSPDEIDKTAWSYPVSPYKQASGTGGVVNTAAVEIYNKLNGTPLEAKAAQSSLALTWGSREAERGIALVKADEGKETPEMYCRSDQGWREMLPGGLRPHFLEDHDKPICVFHETLVAQELATNSEKEEETVRRRIAGKIVMLGVSLPESSDHVQTPLHGRVPGVYLHAMALDNLLTYGPDYREEISLHLAADASHLKLFGFLVLAIVLIVVFKPVLEAVRDAIVRGFAKPAKVIQAKWKAASSHIAKWVLAILFALIKIFENLSGLLLGTAVTGVLALIGTLVFHIGFISTFSVAMFIVATEWLEIKDKLSKKFSPKKKNLKRTMPAIKGQR
jgi:hypothetical protein